MDAFQCEDCSNQLWKQLISSRDFASTAHCGTGPEAQGAMRVRERERQARSGLQTVKDAPAPPCSNWALAVDVLGQRPSCTTYTGLGLGLELYLH